MNPKIQFVISDIPKIHVFPEHSIGLFGLQCPACNNSATIVYGKPYQISQMVTDRRKARIQSYDLENTEGWNKYSITFTPSKKIPIETREDDGRIL